MVVVLSQHKNQVLVLFPPYSVLVILGLTQENEANQAGRPEIDLKRNCTRTRLSIQNGSQMALGIVKHL